MVVCAIQGQLSRLSNKIKSNTTRKNIGILTFLVLLIFTFVLFEVMKLNKINTFQSSRWYRFVLVTIFVGFAVVTSVISLEIIICASILIRACSQRKFTQLICYYCSGNGTTKNSPINFSAILKWTFCIWISTSRTRMSLLSVSTIDCISRSILNFNVHFKVILHVKVIMILIEAIKFIISYRHDDELLVD